MSHLNHVVSISGQEVNDIYIVIAEYLSEIEEIKSELKDERIMKGEIDFIARLHKVKDKLFNFVRVIMKDKGIPFLGVCK